MKKLFKELFKCTLPVMTGYIFLGIAFGLLMRQKGFPIYYPIIMSVIIYSGALEFAAVPILSAPFDPLGSFILGLMLSARHLFYGLPMLKKYQNKGKSKPFLIFGLTDETFSILSTMEVPAGLNPKHFYVGVTAFNYAYWNIGTLLGALLGSVLTFNLKGLDFTLTALFIVLFVEQLKDKAGLISGFIGLVATACVLTIFGSEKMVIISMLVILLVLLLCKPILNSSVHINIENSDSTHTGIKDSDSTFKAIKDSDSELYSTAQNPQIKEYKQ